MDIGDILTLGSYHYLFYRCSMRSNCDGKSMRFIILSLCLCEFVTCSNARFSLKDFNVKYAPTPGIQQHSFLPRSLWCIFNLLEQRYTLYVYISFGLFQRLRVIFSFKTMVFVIVPILRIQLPFTIPQTAKRIMRL